MTGAERSELADFRADMVQRFETLEGKVDCVERRLDRWDGAITFVKTAASFVGLGGFGLFIAALIGASK